MIILATDYIDSLKDENGNVPALLNCGIKSKNRIILLRISADLAKYLYLSKTAVYYTLRLHVISTREKQSVRIIMIV